MSELITIPTPRIIKHSQPVQSPVLDAEIIDSAEQVSGYESVRGQRVYMARATYNNLIANRIGWICSLVLISGLVLCGFSLSVVCAISSIQQSAQPAKTR